MTKTGEVAILIPTFDRYLWLARLTKAEIERRWASPPPIFYCGIHGEGAEFLPLQDDPANWVAVLQSAVANLRDLGFTMAYLILDDHPPLGPCDAEHLNHTIPELMRRLSASYIGLQGWDHKRRLSGTILDKDCHCLMRLDSGFTSKFGLHPALWRLDVLAGILAALCTRCDPPAVTPWDFERLSGMADAPFSDDWKQSAYRVYGRGMMLSPAPFYVAACKNLFNAWLRQLHAATHFFTGAAFRSALARWAGLTHERVKRFKKRRRESFRKRGYEADWIKRFTRKKIRKAAETALGFDDVLYEGPYPLYFTGVLRRGGINPHLLRFLERSRDPALGAMLAELKRHVSSSASRTEPDPPELSSQED
jgi:hypothetical protein